MGWEKPAKPDKPADISAPRMPGSARYASNETSLLQTSNESAYHGFMAREKNTATTGHYVLPPPKSAGRIMPERARRELYQKFQAHTDEVLTTFLDILRDDRVNPSDRIAAGKEILNRGWGQAPNVSIVDATLKVEHSVNSDALRQMSAEELSSVESLLSRLVGNESADHAILDAEAVETSNESAGHAPAQGRNEVENHAPAQDRNESASHAPASAPEPPSGPRRRQRRV